jgi:hypothetical protein
MGPMRVLLSMTVALALLAASTAFGMRAPARIWLVTPTSVAGSGFPAGKVTVTARVQEQKAVRVVRASPAGRFTARFTTPIKASGCQGTASVTAISATGVRAILRIPANAKDCPPPIDVP